MEGHYNKIGMLNEEFFSSSAAVICKLRIKIQKLEECISKFKEYDKKRQEYYKAVVEKIGEQASYIQELEDTTQMGKLMRLNKAYKAHLNVLEKRKFLEKIAAMSDEEVTAAYDRYSLLKANEKLKKDNKMLRETIEVLVAKLNKK